MKKIFLFVLVLGLGVWSTVSAAMIPGAFVTTWKTDNPGGVANQIIIPIAGAGYNYNIYWSGVDTAYTGQLLARTALTTITFPSAGTYQVQITGTFPQIYINNNANTRQKLLSIDQWGTGLWRSMAGAFFGANNMVINATDAPMLTSPAAMSFSQMFQGATLLVDNGGAMNTWDTSKVNTMANMFNGATNFNGSIGNWNTSNVTTMASLFRNTKVFNQPLNSWDTSKVTTFASMFQGASIFNQNLNTWNTSSGTTMASMFNGATSFDGVIGNWNTSNVATMASMFANAKAFNQPLDSWNTSNVTTMASMFQGTNNFNQPLDSWNTSNVTTMASMFYEAAKFNGSVGNWDTSKVTNFSRMFGGYNAGTVFNQPIGNWDTSSATTMGTMFQMNSAFNQPIGNWDMSNVTDIGYMFAGFNTVCPFDQDVSNWDTSKVVNMEAVFSSSLFNQPLNSWNTSKVTNMYAMFWANELFNQPLNNWDTSKVTNMYGTFYDAKSFDQNLSGWNIESLTNATEMFFGGKLSLVNYDALLNGWANQIVKLSVPFHGGDSQYCLGVNSRNDILVGTNLWNIQDGGQSCILDLTLSNTSIYENTTEVGILSGTSILSGSSYSYALTGGTGDIDNPFFVMSGDQLLFLSAPDFETPLDQGDGSENNTYSVRIQINDGNGSVFEKIFIITVLDRDEIAPIITLEGDSSGTIIAGSSRLDPGASWIDDVDGSGMILLPTSGSVDRDTPGIYILEYTYIDAAGNTGNIVIRQITVVPNLGPIVTLSGSGSITILAGSGRTDPGATWLDDADGTGIIFIPTSGSVNLSVPGTYVLSYTYTDTAGNPGNIVIRTVIVQQKSSGGGGGGWTTPKDICPDGDYSPSYYDGSCGILPTTGTVDETTFNSSIGKTCFTPLNKKTIDQGIQVSDAFKIAHQMIYSYELTRWQGTADYRPFDYLTREEAARFMVEFAENVLCRKKTRTYNTTFSDLEGANSSLRSFIRKSYEYEIFNGDKKENDGSTTFRPTDRITNDELTAIMVRLVTNTILEEPEDDWANPYRMTLSNYAKVSRLNDRGRGNIAEVIYDLYRNNTYELKDVGYIIK